MVDWGRESCLGPAEISFLSSWFNSRMGEQDEPKISSFASGMNQKNEELEYKKVGSRFSRVNPGMERFSRELLEEIMCFGKGCECVWNL